MNVHRVGRVRHGLYSLGVNTWPLNSPMMDKSSLVVVIQRHLNVFRNPSYPMFLIPGQLYMDFMDGLRGAFLTRVTY